jgi:sodium pump decarboxylase gamma subunit
MKKRLLVLGMTACLLGLTACGSDAGTTEVLSDDETQAISVADSYISQIDEICSEGMADQYIAYDESLESVFSNWESGIEEIGSYVETTGHEVEFDGDSVIVNAEITGTELDPKGEPRTADIELIYNTDDYSLTSLSFNVNYTFGELMKKAALNTVLGMGTVFAVLILISLIISAFTLIPKIQAMFSKKEEKKASDTENAVDNTIAQIIETQERYDDTELVAVISAAIAAYEAEQGTAVPADGVVIRSIRKVNKSKWQNV